MFGTKIGNAPAAINKKKPKTFFGGGIISDPVFEKVVGVLPVLPDDARFFDGAGLGAEIIVVEWLQDEGNIAWSMF